MSSKLCATHTNSSNPSSHKVGVAVFSEKTGMSGERKRALAIFQKKVGCRFKNPGLLDLAFHHRSFSNETPRNVAAHIRVNNERLEFLGDAVLGLVTAARLYSKMPDSPEGELAKIKSAVVSEDSLSEIAAGLGVSEMLVLGRGEELSGGREKKAILADAMEAVIGALYIDSGFKAAENFVLKLIDPQISSTVLHGNRRDFKSVLQEYVQKRYKTIPSYKLEGKTGPDHDQVFSVSVNVHGKVFGPAEGKNKKEAEQAVARIACKEMGLD